MKDKILAVFGEFQNAGVTPHFHETFSIGVFTKGGCRYKIGTKEEIVKSGEIRIIAPYELHQTFEGRWEYLHFDIDSTFLLNCITDIKQDEIKKFSLNKTFKNEIFKRNAFDLYKAIKFDNLIFEEIFLNFAKGIYINFDKECHLEYKKAVITKAIEYIFANYNDSNLSVEDIANKLNLSTYYFVRSFKKHFGVTPHRFILSLRVEKAKQMILKTNENFSLIAQMCGFSDQSHMIRVFKKILGYKPGILRI